jgi:hypothetical protein
LALVNLGSFYASGTAIKRDHRTAYALLIVALAIGVPPGGHDATVFTLGTIAARLNTKQLASAQELATKIARSIVNRQPSSPGVIKASPGLPSSTS